MIRPSGLTQAEMRASNYEPLIPFTLLDFTQQTRRAIMGKFDTRLNTDNPSLAPRSSRPQMHHFSKVGRRAQGMNMLRQAVPITSIIGVGACVGYAAALLGKVDGVRFMWLVPLACLLGPWLLPTLRATGIVKHGQLQSH